jgi:RNA polymerase sigma factor (sigma-70 family)
MTNYSECSDEALVAACMQGSEAAWNVMVGRYERLVYTVPLRYGFGRSEADDVFQAVWITLLKHLPNLEQPNRLSAWLVTTAKHECWQRRRGAEYERTLSVAPEAIGDGAGQEMEAVEDLLGRFEQYQELEDLIGQLDERCRSLLYYLYFDDQSPSYEEISRLLDMPVGAIGPTRARCLNKLKELLSAAPTER